MICVISLIVFSILGIFSATHRKLAAEAFDCVFRRLTFRKCRTGFDQKIKGKITGKLMKRSPKTAGFVYKHFEIVSWAFTLLLIASLVYSGFSGYNYVRYGNCYGPESTGFCPFNLLQGDVMSELLNNITGGEIILPDADDDPFLGPEDAAVTMIEFGCYMCPYTAEAAPIVKRVLSEYGDQIKFVYRDMPLSELHAHSDILSESANCALDQGKYWEYHDMIFESEYQCHSEEESVDHAEEIAKELELDMELFRDCVDSGKYKGEIRKDFEDGIKGGVTGTPTFFINGRTIVGPRPFAAFKKVIDEELEKAGGMS